MSSGIYNVWKKKLMDAALNLGSDTLKIILLNNSHSFSASAAGYANVSANELATAGGYTQNTKTLGSVTVTQDDGNNKAVFDAADTSWTSATFTCYHAVIFDDTATGDPLICSIDFGGAHQVTAGTFSIQWSSSGIINIT